MQVNNVVKTRYERNLGKLTCEILTDVDRIKSF